MKTNNSPVGRAKRWRARVKKQGKEKARSREVDLSFPRGEW